VCWVCLVAVGVVWGLPRMPHYHEDLPHIYALGGPALVVWYIGLGFLSIGLYGLLAGLLNWEFTRVQRVRAFYYGVGCVVFAGACGVLYVVMMDLSVNVE